MNRRSFLKTLVASGAISATTASGLEIPDIEYPKITYEKEWVSKFRTYLHTVSVPVKDYIQYYYEYSDYEYLPEEVFDHMIESLKAAV